ncbi:hypothetical protein [uncultured Mucilaginibacter sp.]|uniref:hypothetical protein n=1 Tax=uncultured Mucilaginibacter sp. TaxID=797541 RepID=UPI0025E20DCB|nr:hypothetical protein [uncultured Mucilaginibacter sp.]
MDTITIDKKNALKAHKEADGPLKKALATVFGLTWRNPIEAFKSYEEVCEAAGINPIKSLPFPTPTTKKQVSCNGLFKLETIFDEFNRDENGDIWEPNYEDKSEEKHYPWHEYVPSLRRFVYSRTDYSHTYTALGARLATNTAPKAIAIGKNFNKEWNEFLNPQI